ncbi:hypothetical protein ACFLQJ_00360 [Calditrichota bacterium]
MKNSGWIIIAGATIISNAIIWGFVMIACSKALKGTGAFQEIQNILAGGASMSLIIVGGFIVMGGLGAINLPKNKKNSQDPANEE